MSKLSQFYHKQDDTDSTLGDELESVTTSINSTVTDYKYEYGRRYNAFSEDRYPLPNDDDEIKRLELQHKIWRIFLSDRAGLAPISSVDARNALDIGCGTGAWAIDFAESHPECHVIGTDLSPIQPTLVPPNVEFLIDDVTSDWLYPTKFDYIHSRSLQVGIKDWNKLLTEVWNHLEPGGWVEFQEYHWPFKSDDGTIEKFGPNFKLWNDGITAASEKAGTKLDAILRAPDLMKDMGFVDVQYLGSKWPVGNWVKGKKKKKIGTLFQQDMIDALEGVSMRMFTKLLGWKSEDVFKLIDDIKGELKEGKMHVYLPMDFVWAQKPFEADEGRADAMEMDNTG
ncbi:uncharacterized protein MYCFIDRAFT_188664 [Pseudocercospora fijiensis CIRAD86]|uniref:Methyltransferase domain-containing protein n=1 Tax=Pseudocercospora fijiensis (strain CIRAD86) TaxID=383855 RepID=M3AX59_PSEFD|nr:uncharacterized protein MYCFIDRAFT_188664 [Pseudocercospora fijiensis CIRAD86]EME81678.1 hypothetical protein MYCFIDRAFT_188664 [Pseudocercospora fijiensis CIRAD86]